MLSESTLSQFRELVAGHLGLNFPKERQSDLEYRLSRVASTFDFADPEACVKWLLAAPLTQKQIEILAHHLTVGETYFFREKNTFEALRLEILPALIRVWKETGIPPTIWSAGCCTGEEPYSIAILLHELCPDMSGLSVRILATDINSTFLHKAETGRYSEWSFRDTPAWIKARYFRTTSQPGHYEILPSIKKLVTFTYSNLANPDSFPRFPANSVNLILCRNVLMYFDCEAAYRVVRFFHHVLADDGWFLVSPSELSQVLFASFQSTTVLGMMCYTKNCPLLQSIESTWAQSEFLADEMAPAEGHQHHDEREIIEQDWEVRRPGDKETRGQGGFETVSEMASELEVQPASNSPEILYDTAVQLYAAQQYEPAIETLLNLLAVDPTNVQAMTLKARIHANQGKYELALTWCRMAIDTDKLNTPAYYLLATIHQEQNHIEAAVTALKQAMYIEPEYVPAHFALGVIALGQGRRQESEKQLMIALSLLKAYDPQATIPESEGMIAGQLATTIQAMLGQSG
ncbi:MAG: tetratricopeptide repeat protein [Acidobacteria bacterium]|nr:tetratricopeptide repeat protein [Acidobacteriota bacterium]